MWDLIVSVPAHCLSFYFLFIIFNRAGAIISADVLRMSGVRLSSPVAFVT